MTRSLSRRDVIRLGLTGAALSCLGSACPEDERPGSPAPSTADAPVYELTDGTTLYDDFDGNGNYQTYDGRPLAEAGRLNPKLWTAEPGSAITDDDAEEETFATVDPGGRRLVYRSRSPRTTAAIDAFARRGLPLTRGERDALAKLLNRRGLDAAEDLEAEPPERQAAIIGYLLDRGCEVLNERGRRLARAVAGGRADVHDLASLERAGCLPVEAFALARVAGRLDAFRTPAPRAAAARIAVREVLHVLSMRGRLIESIACGDGRPPDSPAELRRVAARGGFVPGEFGPSYVPADSVHGLARTVSTAARGRVLELVNTEARLMRCGLMKPGPILFTDAGTFGAQMLLSSASTAVDVLAALDYHTTIPEQSPGKSWVASLGLRRNAAGEVFVQAQCLNVNTGYEFVRRLAPARPDIWYDLRMDIVTGARDPRLGANRLRIEFFVDGTRLAEEIPEDSPILLDSNRVGYGPQRSVEVGHVRKTGLSVARFDNVRGAYRDRIR